MMTFVLIFLAGFFFTYLISKEFTFLEKASLAFPVGFGLASFTMFKLDVILHSLSLASLQISLSLFIVFCIVGLLVLHLKKTSVIEKPILKIDLAWFNLAWAVFAGVTAYLVWGISTKCLYWPPAEFDTIQGYDLLSKAIAHEGKLANSILTDKQIVKGCGPRLLYPPLLAFCNSICYMLGIETPKIINTLFFVPWVFLFYALLRRFVNSINAIFFTFLMVITPEMFAHGSFSLTNYPTAVYAASAVLSFLIWFEKRIAGFLILSGFMMAFALWTRADVVVVNGALLLAALIVFYREKNWKPLLAFSLSLIVYFVWSSYSKAVIPKEASSFFVDHIFLDFDKLSKVLSTAWSVMSSSSTYGLTFWIFVIGLLINIKPIIQKDNWLFLIIIAVSLGGYTLIYYQIKEDGSLFSNGGWMLSGYKRGLFVYAPLVLAYVSLSKNVKWLFDKIGSVLNG
jgi:hypothetical protein